MFTQTATDVDLNAIIAAAKAALAADLAELGEAPAKERAPQKPKVYADRVGALHDEAPEMTAGQKAAATRAALEEARRAQAARRNGIAEPSSLKDCIAVEMFCGDGCKIGSGHRNLVVVEINAREAVLFYPATLTTIKIARIDFEKDAKPYVTTTAKLLARIESVIASYEKASLDYDVKAAKTAIRALIA